MSADKVVAVTADLMDRSKITGAIEGVRVVRSGADLGTPDVVIVDLAIAGALDQALATGARVLAYGSHVDSANLEAAKEAGAEAMPRSLFFRRLTEGALLS